MAPYLEAACMCRQRQNEAPDFGVVMHISENRTRSFHSSKTFKFSGLHMADAAPEVAADALDKIEKNQRNLFQKSGNCFFHERGACCTLRHYLLRGAKNGMERVVPFSVAGAELRLQSVVFSTVLSVLYLTLCGKRS